MDLHFDAAALPWAARTDTTIVFLIDARDRLEAQLLRDWVGTTSRCIDIGAGYEAAWLAQAVAGEAETWLQPVRLVFLASAANESVSLFKDLIHANRVSPGPLRRRWLVSRRSERVARVAGDGATLGTVVARWHVRHARSRDNLDLVEFVRAQALLALERAERSLRGARYRIPRLMPEVVFADEDFQSELARIAQSDDKPLPDLRRQSARYLDEMAAMQTPFTLDVIMAIYRAGVGSNHDRVIDIRPEQFRRLSELMSSRSVVFLISHKSMLDTVAFSLVMFEANLPVPLTFGGINLKTFGIGALARRAGIIFLRRAFQNNVVYRAVFRRYIDYLIEKRFALLWALEGTRSRTGKLLAPRFGLFSYVLEASLRTDNRDLAWVPVSVGYDQITEVDDYAAEQRGRSKQAEGIGWMLRFFRRGRSKGRIFVRLGEPFDLATSSARQGAWGPVDRHSLVQGVAFESAVRLNNATPVTATAIMTLILLAAGRRAQRVEEIRMLARAGVALLRRRRVEIVGAHDFKKPEAVRSALNVLHEAGLVTYFDEGLERLVRVGNNQHHKAAYYRNTAIHWFVLDAVAELALLASAGARPEADPTEAFFSHAESLRELLRFDFYFPPRAQFRAVLAQRLHDRHAGWQEKVAAGDASAVMAAMNPLFAHAVLRSFIDAYLILATVLVRSRAEGVKADAALVNQSLKLGRQMLLQEAIFSAEAVSRPLFESAAQLAGHRRLLAPATDDPGDVTVLIERRRTWLVELQQVKRGLDQVMWAMLERSAEIT